MEALAVGIILITGPSAAGKSTVAPLLARRFALGVHLEGDWFRRSIVSGRRDMTSAASNEALQQLRLRYELSAAAADRYRAAGFGVVVEDVVAGTLLAEYEQLFTTRPIQVIVLMPSLRSIRQREQHRESSGYAGWTDGELYDAFDRQTPRIGHWIDSSNMTPSQTVDAIVRLPMATVSA